jgi:predicted  nucleic acid-binding Zn-ribbon protein
MDGTTTTTSFFDRFKSPWRNLAWSFRQSRDRWKHKYQELRRQHKRLQNQVRDVRRSRAQWRSRAEQTQDQSQALREEITRLQARVVAAEAAAEKRG